MGRNLEKLSNNNSRLNPRIRPKAARPKSPFPLPFESKKSENSSDFSVRQNLEKYLINFSNSDFKRESGTPCRRNICECPLVRKYQETLRKSNSNHDHFFPRINNNEEWFGKKNRISSAGAERIDSSLIDFEMNKIKTTEEKSSDYGKIKSDVKESRSGSSYNTLRSIRSTRAQELRSKSNRDLLKAKSAGEEDRITISPYAISCCQKKKKSLSTTSCDTKSHISTLDSKRKPKTDQEKRFKAQTGETKKTGSSDFERQKTRDVIYPKIFKRPELGTSKQSSRTSLDSEDVKSGLKKSETFFICKGPKKGESDDLLKSTPESSTTDYDESVSNAESDEDEIDSPKPNPLTHNDSFCIIAKSSQNWSQKNRSDDEKLLRYGLTIKNKKDEKGILKNVNRDLKSVDSLEKIESEKIVRFSDEQSRKRKAVRKTVRRKRLQNSLVGAWYRRNKLFQRYLQILKSKSVLHVSYEDTPDDLKSYQVSPYMRDRYEAEMIGLVPRQGRCTRSKIKEKRN